MLKVQRTLKKSTAGPLQVLLQDETCEESGEDMMARQLGLEMVYHLYTLQHVDQLLEYHKKGGFTALIRLMAPSPGM